MTAVFVYGTLKPGHSRWPVLASYAIGDPTADSIDGTLYDTGYSWPAAVVNGPGKVAGFTVPVLEEVIPILDHMEGVPDLFERVLTTTHNGVEAWVYHWPNTTKTFTEVDVW